MKNIVKKLDVLEIFIVMALVFLFMLMIFTVFVLIDHNNKKIIAEDYCNTTFTSFVEIDDQFFCLDEVGRFIKVENLK